MAGLDTHPLTAKPHHPTPRGPPESIRGHVLAIRSPETCPRALWACHLCVREETRAWEAMARGHVGFVGGKVGPRSQHSGSLPAPGQKLRSERSGGQAWGSEGEPKDARGQLALRVAPAQGAHRPS